MRAIVLALTVGLLGTSPTASAQGQSAPRPATPPPTAATAPAPAAATAPPAPAAPTEDAGWPRQLEKDGAVLVYYQPELDEWKDYKEVRCRIAFSLTPKGGKAVLGVASLAANTLVDRDARTAFLRDIKVSSVRFPSADATTQKALEQVFRSMIPTGGEPVSVDRIMAMIERDKVPAKGAPLKNDPPPIVTSGVPAVLLILDGDPIGAPIEQTDLQFVVNTNWDLFYQKSTRKYFLLTSKHWFTSADLRGPWLATQALPQDLGKLPAGQNFDDVKKMIPPPAGTGPAPRVYYSKVPAELILISGAPVFAKLPGTGLLYVTNTDNDLFADAAKKRFFVLLSGRWFESSSLTGPWTYAGANLPADFAKIAPTSAKARVLVSVPGTQENADAVMLAQIPTTAVIDKALAAAAVRVAYDGPPQFVPIPGTAIQFAVNTEQRVLKVNNVYYLCFQGVWFVALAPTGPWRTADSVPPEIYSIPPSSPVYNVTYVTQTNATPTTVESSTSDGYYGSFVFSVGLGFAIGYGTGWYYPPYYYGPPGYYYPYRPYGPSYGVGAVYNPATGGYAVGRAAYGPYGAAGGAAWYNPQTGRYGRAASAQGWYGGRTVASSYNPWTGTYARTSQSHNSYAQWGSSVATRGNQWVQTGHVTTAGGTTAAYRTSSGKSGVVRRNENGTVARTDNGVYAGRDGNVYKRNSRGDWSQYENGNWNQVDRSAPQARDLDRSASDRQRGQANAERNRARAPSGGARPSSGARPSGGTRPSGGGARGGGGRRR